MPWLTAADAATRPPTSPQAQPLAQGCPERSGPAAWSPKRACACALVHCVHKVARCYCCCNHGPSAPLAAPALGSCASQGALSGLGRRALREHRPAHPQPLPPLLELSAQVAASQVAADGTARVVLGPPGTGKSCLLHQFIERAFQGSSSHTIGVEFGSRLIEIGGQVIKLVGVRVRVRAS